MPSNGQKGAADPPSASGGHQARRNKVGEARLPPTIALLAAIALYALLPEALLLGPRFIVPSVEVLLLLAVVATNPRRITRQTRYSRLLSLLMAGLVVATNLLSLGLLIHELVSRQHAKGSALLLAGAAGVGQRTRSRSRSPTGSWTAEGRSRGPSGHEISCRSA